MLPVRNSEVIMVGVWFKNLRRKMVRVLGASFDGFVRTITKEHNAFQEPFGGRRGECCRLAAGTQQVHPPHSLQDRGV